jgi:hypothetical protein
MEKFISRMLRRVILAGTDVSAEGIISVKRIGELGTTLAVTSNKHTALVASYY